MVDFRQFDAKAEMVRRLRGDSEQICVDFGHVKQEDRDDFLEMLQDNGFIKPFPEHKLSYWNGLELKPKYTIDVYLPVYRTIYSFGMQNTPYMDSFCEWEVGSLVIPDYDRMLWYTRYDEYEQASDEA